MKRRGFKGSRVQEFKSCVNYSLLATWLCGYVAVSLCHAGEISQQQIEAAVKNFIQNQYSGEEVSITVASLKQKISVAGQDYVLVPGFPAGKKLLGRIFVPVEIQFSGKIRKKILVPVKVAVYRKVAYLQKEAVHGAPLAQDMILWKRMDISRLPGDVIQDFSQIENKQAKKNLPEGVILRLSFFEDVPLVYEDEPVLVMARKGLLEVSAVGVAKEDGSLGEWIRVFNKDSKTYLKARVIEKGKVEILF